MACGRELTPQICSHICKLHTINKWGARRIHKVHPDIPILTIHYTIQQEANHKDNISCPRPGQPQKLSDEDYDYIYKLIIHNPYIRY